MQEIEFGLIVGNCQNVACQDSILALWGREVQEGSRLQKFDSQEGEGMSNFSRESQEKEAKGTGQFVGSFLLLLQQ